MRNKRSRLRIDFKALGFSSSSSSTASGRLYRRPSHAPRKPELIFSKARIVVLQSSEMRNFFEKSEFFACSEIFVWSTRTQGTRNCPEREALESESGRSPHAAPPWPTNMHRFREKADSKKNILRSNSPTGNYSGLSFFLGSFSLLLATHLLMFAFRSMRLRTSSRACSGANPFPSTLLRSSSSDIVQSAFDKLF